jgi:hypothetical protein
MIKIISSRVGVPGEAFVPEEGVNLEALIVHGFVVDTATTKSAKTTTDEPKD